VPRIRVVFYQETAGLAPILEWLDALPPKAQDKCRLKIERLQDFARIIHERFCCNRGFATATSLGAVGPASRQAGSPLGRSTYCFKYASLPRGSARLSRLATARFRDEPS
jgi:hypothetical protein